MKKYSTTSITLNIYTNNLNPEIINDYLSIDGITSIYKTNQISDLGTVIKVNSWNCKMLEFKSYTLEENMIKALDILKKNKNKINAFIDKNMKISLDIVTYMVKNDSVGLDLNIELIKILSDLNIELSYNVYEK